MVLLVGNLKREKNVIECTAKGLKMFTAKCQKTSYMPCKQANKLMEMMKDPNKFKNNATEVENKGYSL